MANTLDSPINIVGYIIRSLGDKAGDYLYGSTNGSLIITPVAARCIDPKGEDKLLYDVTGQVFMILDVVLADYYEPERGCYDYVGAAEAQSPELIRRLRLRDNHH